MEILSCMQFVLHAGQVGVFFLNNFALVEQLKNSERLNFVRKKKRRRPRKARRWLHRRQGSVCPQPEFFFWFTSIRVLRDPSRLKYRLLRDLLYEEAMCEGSFGNGLPYAARAVP